jgi:hypothetical protein
VTERERKDGKGPEKKFIEWGNENEKCRKTFSYIRSLLFVVVWRLENRAAIRARPILVHGKEAQDKSFSGEKAENTSLESPRSVRVFM